MQISGHMVLKESVEYIHDIKNIGVTFLGK